MLNKKFIILLIFCCIISAQVVFADENTTIVGETESGSFLDLNSDIQRLDSGDELTLDKNYTYSYSTDSNYKNGITINVDGITIDGGGYTINASDSARIFYISSNNVALKNINFVNANINAPGGAIYITKGCLVTVENCNFINNSAYGNASYGGAIQNSGIVNILKSKFISNTAFGSAAVDNNNGVLHIDSSYFDGNVAINRDAGAVSNAGGGNGICIIQNSIFTNNKAYRDGGAIKNNNEGGNGYLTVINSTFISNKVEGQLDKSGRDDAYGGAIYNWGGNLIIEDSLFINNSATKWGGSVISSGGVFTSTANITNSLFENNTANGGSAIFFGMSTESFVTSSVFINNYKDAVYVGYSTREVNLDDNWWGNNTPDFTKLLTLERTFEVNNYAVLNTTPNPVIIGKDEEISLTFGFYRNASDKLININRPIELSATGIVLSNTSGNTPLPTTFLSNNYGKYNVIASVDGNDYTFDINVVNSSTIKANGIVNGSDVLINVDVTPITANGNVTFTINDKNYLITLADASGSLTIKNLKSGVYNIKLTYNGDSKHAGASTNITFNITPDSQVIINAYDVVKYYGASQRFMVNVTDSKGNALENITVSITVNGISYSKTTNKNGLTSVPLNLGSGTYIVKTTYDNKVINSTVTIMPTVNADNLTKMFRNASQYSAVFYKSDGSLLTNTSVSFNINGIFYYKTTNSNGIARLNINLGQGEYILTAINPSTGEMHTNTILVRSLISENNNLVMYYKNGSRYSVKLLDSSGKAVGSGVEVKFNINGIFYTKSTNADGIAKLNLNLPPEDYVITAEYNQCKVSNNIKVLSVLNASNVAKTYGSSNQFKCNLVDGMGRSLQGKIISFNINGLFYNKSTDSNGQAKLNINLQAGEYIITSTYNGLSISNKVTVTV